MVNQSGILCVIGEVGLNNAPWIDELVKPTEMAPTDNPDKGELTLEGTSTPADWLAMEVNFSEELCNEFTTQKQILGNSLFTGKTLSIQINLIGFLILNNKKLFFCFFSFFRISF